MRRRPLLHLLELADQQAIAAAPLAGLPLVTGECAHEGGYHAWPPIEQVQRWLAEVEINEQRPAARYEHILARCR